MISYRKTVCGIINRKYQNIVYMANLFLFGFFLFVFSYYFCMSVIAIRYASHTSKAPCEPTQHCWPATPNMVGCYMLCPFTHPVTCCCVLLHPFARGLRYFKSKSLLSTINIFTLYNDPYIFLICYYTFYTVLYMELYSVTT